MQAAFLVSAKSFSEKQVGVLFFVFGMTQFLCMPIAGYVLDYSNRKILWVIGASIICSVLTVIAPIVALEDGANLWLLILLNIAKGLTTAIMPPAFNGITLGIVGTKGFTLQVSRNRMMGHYGTAFVVFSGSLLAYLFYPKIRELFIVSPLAAIMVYWYMSHIIPAHVNRNAARALISESPTLEEYESSDELSSTRQQANVIESSGGDPNDKNDNNRNDHLSLPPSQIVAPRVYGAHTPKAMESSYQPPTIDGFAEANEVSKAHNTQQQDKDTAFETTSKLLDLSQMKKIERKGSRFSKSSLPSFQLGHRADNGSNRNDDSEVDGLRARTPLSVLLQPRLFIYCAIVFFFNLANASVLPLVMQSLALEEPRSGILLSGVCILIAQTCMASFAKICGDYSPYWGRKNLVLVGLLALTTRCFALTFLISAQDTVQTPRASHIVKALILSTELLDSVGAGIFWTMTILVTGDISGGTGRFSLLLGVTSACMCLGSTISGYVAQAIAQDHGYPNAFLALGITSLVPFTLYLTLMPETLPDHARKTMRHHFLREMIERLDEARRRILRFGTTENETIQIVHAQRDATASETRGTGQFELV